MVTLRLKGSEAVECRLGACARCQSSVPGDVMAVSHFCDFVARICQVQLACDMRHSNSGISQSCVLRESIEQHFDVLKVGLAAICRCSAP